MCSLRYLCRCRYLAKADRTKKDNDLGCLSYLFFFNGAGAPRCNLYGGSVAQSIFDIQDAFEDYWWFDIGCGPPSA